MTRSEEFKLIFGAISEYAELHELSAEEIIDIFNEGVLHFTYPPLVTPLVTGYESKKQIGKINLAVLKLEIKELQDTLKYLPSCEIQKQDKILDRINAINKLIIKHVNEG